MAVTLLLTVGCFNPQNESDLANPNQTVTEHDSGDISNGASAATISKNIDSSILRTAIASNDGVFTARQSRPLLYTKQAELTYCESIDGEAGTYSGYRDLKRYPLASLSKIFVSAWALWKLGADYRFKSQWSLRKISDDGTYDAYLRTGFDPVVNIEKILYSLAELNKKGVRRIRQLVVDESTQIYLSVLSNPHIELQNVPVGTSQSVENLNLILNSKNWGPQAEAAQIKLQQGYKNIKIPASFSVENVYFRQAKAIDKSYYTESAVVVSSILIKYLKEINVKSNNYITDALFSFLGGESEFLKFQTNIMKIDSTDLQIKTGSGLPTQINGKRFDNQGSCLSVLKTLKFLTQISRLMGIDLGHVLLTAGKDSGTYDSAINFKSLLALKTGRLYDVPTMNVAGVSSAGTKPLYFVFMAHDFSNNQESMMKEKRDGLLKDSVNYHKSQKPFFTLIQDTLFLKPVQ